MEIDIIDRMSAIESIRPAIFLTAEWSYLAMLNYEIDPAVLAFFVPQARNWIFGTAKLMSVLSAFSFKMRAVAEFQFRFIAISRKSTCDFMFGEKLRRLAARSRFYQGIGSAKSHRIRCSKILQRELFRPAHVAPY